MVSDTTARTGSAAALTVRNKVGLGLSALLGLGDLVSLLVTPDPGPGENGPPTSVLIAGTVLGVITLLAVVHAWRTGNRVSARIVAGTRILSAITALPAFFASDVPAGFVLTAAAGIVVTVIAVALVLSRPAAD